MFTGLIEELGILEQARSLGGGGREFRVRARKVLEDLQVGDSLAVNGVCQTICTLDQSGCSFQAVGATLEKTTLGRLRPGEMVNLERSCTPSTRLGGHLVQGHVSGLATFTGKHGKDGTELMEFQVPRELLALCCAEGSVCLDGVSLTVAELEADCIRVGIIPHTLNHTTLGRLGPGQAVNLETDILARYAWRFFVLGRADRSTAATMEPVHHGSPDAWAALRDWGYA